MSLKFDEDIVLEFSWVAIKVWENFNLIFIIFWVTWQKNGFRVDVKDIPKLSRYSDKYSRSF